MTWRLEMDEATGLYTIHDSEGEFARVTAVRADHDRARVLWASQALLDAATEALPYVESAQDDPAYKAGAVKRVADRLRYVIAQATGVPQ